MQVILGEGAVAFPVPGHSRYRELPVPGALAPIVRALWVSTAVDFPLADPVPYQLVLPDGHGDVIVGAGLDAVAVGSATSAARVPIRPGVHLVGARLRPGALPVLTGVRASELRDRDLSLGTIEGDSDDLPGRLEALSRLLVGLRNRVPRSAVRAQSACRVIEGQARAPGVATLARELGMSDRAVRSLFAEHVGTSPKTLHQVRRLQRIMRMAARNPGLGLGELAARGGYADQSHLSRQCRALSGLTPAGLLGVARS